MFEKTTGLLKDHQKSANKLGEELREIGEISECQTDRYRKMMAVVHTLGLTTMEGDRLRRFRSQQRLSRRLETPVDTYSSLSLQYRRRRQDPNLDTSHLTLEEEGEGREDAAENTLYESMVPKNKRSS